MWLSLETGIRYYGEVKGGRDEDDAIFAQRVQEVFEAQSELQEKEKVIDDTEKVIGNPPKSKETDSKRVKNSQPIK